MNQTIEYWPCIVVKGYASPLDHLRIGHDGMSKFALVTCSGAYSGQRSGILTHVNYDFVVSVSNSGMFIDRISWEPGFGIHIPGREVCETSKSLLFICLADHQLSSPETISPIRDLPAEDNDAFIARRIRLLGQPIDSF